jgi:hypothetical protein
MVRLEQDHQVGGRHRGQQVRRAGHGPAVHLPCGHVRIVIADGGAASAQPAGDRPGRRFPLVGDVPLVGHAEEQHPRAVDRLGVAVEQFGGAVGDITGHPAVDLLGQLDEPERVAERTHLIGQVVGVDGDAVAADPGPGVERREAERLGGRAPDRVPQVHIQLTAEDGHLVDQGDVHVPVGVLQQLGHLRLAGRLGPHHLVTDPLVEAHRRVRAGRRDPADDLGRVRQAELGVARVDPLRRERQREAEPGAQPGRLLQQRPDHLLGGAGIGRRFQRHHGARPQQPAGGPRRRPDRAQVGPAGHRQGRRHADDDHVLRPDLRLGRHGPEPLADHPGHLGVGHVVHVRPAGHQAGHDLGPGVIAGHPEPGPRRLDREREADVAEPDD